MSAETKAKKPSPFRAFMRFCRSLFAKRQLKKEPPSHFTWFSRFLEDLEQDSEAYERAQMAVDLCDDALEIMSQRLHLIEQLKDISEGLIGAECFARLSPEDAEELTRLIMQYDAASKDKNELKYRVTGFDNAIEAVSGVEAEARAAVTEIREAEEKQRVFKQDLNYLQGEKAELEYERETLVFATGFVERFSLIVIIVLSVTAIGLGIVFAINGTPTFLPIAILIALITAVVLGTRYMRGKIKRDLELNRRKQLRAVEIINKKNIIYAHYTNFLNYEYKKFNVRNAEMLRVHLRDYESYKQLSKRFDSMRSIVKQTGEELESFMRTRRIPMSASLDPFAHADSAETQMQLHKQFLADKDSVENRLAELDTHIAALWDKLSAIKAVDEAENGAVSDVITAYLDLAGRMMERGVEKG